MRVATRLSPREHSVFAMYLASVLAGYSAVAGAQRPPNVRPLGPIVARSVEPLASVSQVRALPDGRVLANDLTGRRVLMFDATLSVATVIADSTSATANAYSSRLGGLIAYRGDSTLFADPASLSMLVIDPAGRIVRAMSIPQPNDAQSLIGGPFGTPGFDLRGRLVYRSAIRPTSPVQGAAPAQPPDSASIVRFDLSTRHLDTLGRFGIPVGKVKRSKGEDGWIRQIAVVNPIPWTDDWSLLSDGRIAIVRGREYRVDFIGTDGVIRAGPRIPFDWQSLSDADKVAIIDSTKAAMDKLRADLVAESSISAPSPTATSAIGGGRELAQPEGTAMRNGAPGSPDASLMFPPLEYFSPSELPDYRPAFRQGASRGDLDGNLWIRTTAGGVDGTVYDVIDRDGRLSERVLVPSGRVVVGFGLGGVVYLSVRDGQIVRLERARVR
jgi:hypothetical protein